MPETHGGYALVVRTGLPFQQALRATVEALRAEGFGVLTEIDVKETLREKLGVEFRNYRIPGACNPPLAHRALSTTLDVGLLLPCNVVVYEDEGGTTVSLLDPTAMLGLIPHPALQEVAREAQARLERVARALEQKGA